MRVMYKRRAQGIVMGGAGGVYRCCGRETGGKGG
jgi:hypothetical protein